MRSFFIFILLLSVNAEDCLTTVECNNFITTYPLFYYLQSTSCRFDEYCITQCVDISQCPYPSFGLPYVTDYQYRSVSGMQVVRPTILSNSTNCNSLGLQLKQLFQQVINALVPP